MTGERQTILLGMALLATLNGAQAEQKCDADKPETTPSARFKINGEKGTVFDTMTKLTWKICPEGIIYSNNRCTGNADFTWDNAMKNLVDKNNGWRLPNIDELKSIIEKRCAEPAINLQVFPNTQSSPFWSASAFAGDSDYAYNVYFGRGLVSNDLKSNLFYVRLVRGKQWFDPAGILVKNK
jgi:hypothetical protein